MRNVIIKPILFQLIYLFCASAMAQNSNGLIGYYPFNGNANDQSSNAKNGVVYGATLTEDRFGKKDAAYSFDGINDYIKLTNAENLRNNKFSYSMWVKPGDFAQGTASVFFEAGSYYSQPGLIVSINNNYLNTVGWRVTTGNSDNTNMFLQNDKLPNFDLWYHVVITRGDNKVTLWVNGEIVKSISIEGKLPYYSSQLDAYIGCRDQVWQFFKGVIDDIKVYDKELTSSEISSLYNEGLCFENITVTDALIINTVITGYNPVTYLNSIKIFPNPTNDELTINYGNYNTMPGYTLKISNSLGQTVFSSAINKEESRVNLSSFGGEGIYFVQIIDADNNIKDTRKIVLQ